jgi:hypothetical protein
MGMGAWKHGDGRLGMWRRESDYFSPFQCVDGNMIFFNFFSVWMGSIISVVSVGMGVWEWERF